MSSKKNKLQNPIPTNDLIRLMKKYYPNAECALNHSNPEQLLIATILSAQCTDVRVNSVTKNLFKKYLTIKNFADADLRELEQDIHSTGFYINKAKNIKMCAQKIISEHSGEVPRDMESLIKLAGVGRKTANVVLGNAFNTPSGVVVDTHVMRLSQRMGLTKKQTAEKIEEDLIQLVPKKYWVKFPHWLIVHGRSICKARKPACDLCFLDDICPKRI